MDDRNYTRRKWTPSDEELIIESSSRELDETWDQPNIRPYNLALRFQPLRHNETIMQPA